MIRVGSMDGCWFCGEVTRTVVAGRMSSEADGVLNGDCLLHKSGGVSSTACNENDCLIAKKSWKHTALKLDSVAGVVAFRRSFFFRTNVFVSKDFSMADVGVDGSRNEKK